jgi:hypothetical protein
MTTFVTVGGRASAKQPQKALDNEVGDLLRTTAYDELFVQANVRKQHGLLDEQSYFVTNNAQTGIAIPAAASFAATTPAAVIYNTASVADPTAKAIYLDYLCLVTTAAGSWASAGVNLQAMVYTDTGDRYTSGGTDLTANIVSPNTDGPRSALAKVRFGNITAAAATGNVRPICGLRILRPAVSATVADVVGETKYLNFGGVEGMFNGSITVANANVIPVPLPAIRVGPGASCLIYIVMNGTTPSAASYAPEFGWWER